MIKVDYKKRQKLLIQCYYFKLDVRKNMEYYYDLFLTKGSLVKSMHKQGICDDGLVSSLNNNIMKSEILNEYENLFKDDLVNVQRYCQKTNKEEKLIFLDNYFRRETFTDKKILKFLNDITGRNRRSKAKFGLEKIAKCLLDLVILELMDADVIKVSNEKLINNVLVRGMMLPQVLGLTDKEKATLTKNSLNEFEISEHMETPNIEQFFKSKVDDYIEPYSNILFSKEQIEEPEFMNTTLDRFKELLNKVKSESKKKEIIQLIDTIVEDTSNFQLTNLFLNYLSKLSIYQNEKISQNISSNAEKLYNEYRDEVLLECKRSDNYLICTYCARNYTSLVQGYDSAKTAELDHIFPKSIYSIDCICKKNIVPVCPSCNRSKSNNGSYIALDSLLGEVSKGKMPFEIESISSKCFDEREYKVNIKSVSNELTNFLKGTLHIEELYNMHAKRAEEIFSRLIEIDSYENLKTKDSIEEVLSNGSILTYFGDLNKEHKQMDSMDYFTSEIIRYWFEYNE